MFRIAVAVALMAAMAGTVAVASSAKSSAAEIVFVARSTHSGPHITYAVHADGSSLRNVPIGKAPMVFWSPNGKRVATADSALVIRDADGSHAITVIKCGAGCDVAWAPGGNRLAYTVLDRCGHAACPSSLGIVGANGKGSRTLLRFGGASVVSPSWSPDGTLIAFVESAGGVADLDVVHPNGHGFTRLAPIDGSSYYPQYHPSWTTDSRAILFSAKRAGVARVLDVTRDGRELHTLADGNFPVVSPDGKRIAFVRNGIAYVMPEAGGKQTKISSGVASVLAWSPDSTRLAFVTSERKIAVADAATGSSHAITAAYDSVTAVSWRLS